MLDPLDASRAIGGAERSGRRKKEGVWVGTLGSVLFFGHSREQGADFA